MTQSPLYSVLSKVSHIEPAIERVDSDNKSYYLGSVTLIEASPGAFPLEVIQDDWNSTLSPLDSHIVDIARRSYSKGTSRKSSDVALLRRLLRDKHTSPFEHVSFTFDIECPLYVAAQFMRHRTGKYNQASYRYSQAPDKIYEPYAFFGQHKQNKQCTDTSSYLEDQKDLHDSYRGSISSSYESYTKLLEAGVSREIARGILPTATFTSFVVTMDLHNLLHFLRLRTASDAQFEIRVIADKMLEYIELLAPATIKAARDYIFNAVTLSSADIAALKELLNKVSLHSYEIDNVVSLLKKEQGYTITSSEASELHEKISLFLNILSD